MRIGQSVIGAAPYVIAEIGVNHDGDPDRAVSLATAAALAGADAVKLQYFTASGLMSRASRLAAYQAGAGERDPTEMLRRLELTIEQMAPVVEAAHRAGRHAIVTVFSVELVDRAQTLPWDAYKTASPDIINRPLLQRLAQTGKPIILSTGAADFDEVVRAVRWLEHAHDRLAVLQCVSSYPTPQSRAALAGIRALRRALPASIPIGYSDHTPDSDTGALAVAAGAAILEKHLTYSRGAPGPDHSASLEPHHLAAYVRAAHAASAALGPEVKRVLPEESDVRAVSRQSLVAARTMPPGHVISPADVTIKRPGSGLAPFRLEETIGKRTRRAVEADTPIVEEDLA